MARHRYNPADLYGTFQEQSRLGQLGFLMRGRVVDHMPPLREDNPWLTSPLYDLTHVQDATFDDGVAHRALNAAVKAGTYEFVSPEPVIALMAYLERGIDGPVMMQAHRKSNGSVMNVFIFLADKGRWFVPTAFHCIATAECDTWEVRVHKRAMADPDFRGEAFQTVTLWLARSAIIAAKRLAEMEVEYVYAPVGRDGTKVAERRERLGLTPIPPVKRIVHLRKRVLIKPQPVAPVPSGPREPYDYWKAEWLRHLRNGRVVTVRRNPALLNRPKKRPRPYIEVRE